MAPAALARVHQRYVSPLVVTVAVLVQPVACALEAAALGIAPMPGLAFGVGAALLVAGGGVVAAAGADTAEVEAAGRPIADMLSHAAVLGTTFSCSLASDHHCVRFRRGHRRERGGPLAAPAARRPAARTTRTTAAAATTRMVPEAATARRWKARRTARPVRAHAAIQGAWYERSRYETSGVPFHWQLNAHHLGGV